MVLQHSFEGDVQYVKNNRFVYILDCDIFVKYAILTQHLTLFWFAMVLNEYKPTFQFRKGRKDAKFGECLYLRPPLLCAEPVRRTDFSI
jgi:hypothetical protein